MSISIICMNCHTSYMVPDGQAGRTVTCKRCNALIDVPGGPGGAAGGVAPSLRGNVSSPYERILGKPTPLILDILGIHTRWAPEVGARDIFKLIWGLRDVVMLVIILALWSSYSATALEAGQASPFFLGGALILLFFGALQMSAISRGLATSIGGGRNSSTVVSHVVSSFLLVATDPRTALPGLRTLFLGLLALVASLSLASQSGNWGNIVALRSLPSSRSTGGNGSEVSPSAPETPVAPAPAPAPPPPPPKAVPIAPPPTTQEKPLPPPDDNTPIPPPPG